MQMCNSTEQLTTDELKIRELAQDYLKIEENTQYLTHLVRYTSRRHRVFLKNQQQLPQLKSLAALSVQLAYLLFTCNIKQTNLLVNQKLMLMHPNRKQNNPEVICQYILEKDYVYLREDEQNIIKKSFKIHQFSHQDQRIYGQSALQYINTLTKWAQIHFDKVKLPNDKAICKQFINLSLIVRNFLQPKQLNLPHPRVVILSFEESELFRQHSILVKVMNNSLFSAIRNCKNKQLFQQIVRFQWQLLQLKNNKSMIDNHSLQIEKSIQNLLLLFIKHQVMTVQQSLNDQSKNQQINNRNPPHSSSTNKPTTGQGNRPYILGQIQGKTPVDRRYFCRVLVHQRPIREFTAKTYDSIVFQAVNNYNREDETDKQVNISDKNKQSLAKNQFLIEYYPAKGMLSVKYITPIQLNIQNTDLVMFQCNNIAYHWSNVSMQLVQKSQSKQIKRKQRYLSIKTISHLQIAQKPLLKLMLMIDLVMMCAKIAEPQLKKNMVRTQQYHVIEDLGKKVDHMIKLFIRKLQKYYKMIADTENYHNDHQ